MTATLAIVPNMYAPVIREAVWTPEKVDHLWRVVQQHGGLFTDMQRGDREFWNAVIADEGSFWFEVVEPKHDTVVGVIFYTDIAAPDVNAWYVFFDEQTAAKKDLVAETISFVFSNFPAQRITVHMPDTYHALYRLLKKVGFSREGMKRKAVAIGRKWHDVFVFGLLREEWNNGRV